MAFRPFTTMGAKTDETIREYVAGVGAITLAWAHLELALDILLALDEHLSVEKPGARHPIAFSAKIDRLTKSLVKKKSHALLYRWEWIQVITLSTTASQRRNLVVHGALISTLADPEIQLLRIARNRDDEDLEAGKISLHEMFVIFQMIFEVASHAYNLVLRIVREQMPEHAEKVGHSGSIDVSGFEWPAVNPKYTKSRKNHERDVD